MIKLYTLDDMTRLINGAFQPGSGVATSLDPLAARRGVRATSWEKINYKYSAQGQAWGSSTTMLGSLPTVNTERFPYYYGTFSYFAQAAGGASVANDRFFLQADNSIDGASNAAAYLRSAILAAAIPAGTIMISIETSIPILFQRMLSFSVPGASTLTYDEQWSFDGVKITWA